MRPLHVSMGLVVVGAVAFVAGVHGQFGLWWALIMGGTLAVVGGLTLVRVDDDHKGNRQ
ncbi:hypothetical protein [Nonomuraea sp. NPDC050786]|uniref:hypothetical protein n=1 Tax=Nonomuraea sp. NPDC050786 TaxID=3154840 RepID=UPI00340D9275